MLKEILNEVKNRDVVFTKLCSILKKCNINESKFKICDRNIEELDFIFYDDLTNNHLINIYRVSLLELFYGEWDELDTEPFYKHYWNIIKKTYKSDKEFVESYCYAISGITKSWLNFYDKPDYSTNVDGRPLDTYNNNVEVFNKMLRYVRELIKEEVKGCPHMNIEVKDPTFKLIMNGLQLKKIV